jgi:F-type H+-transporting ATPase subunit c
LTDPDCIDGLAGAGAAAEEGGAGGAGGLSRSGRASRWTGGARCGHRPGPSLRATPPAARRANPGAAGQITTQMIIGLALIESLALIAFVIAILIQGKI